MKRSFAIVFLFLYFYNIVGYLALFGFMQYRVRLEVKELIKENVAESLLITLAFHTSHLSQLHWVDDREFWYDGNLYDVLRASSNADTTYLTCLNDTQEEQLFEHLDDHVQRQMGHSGLADRLDVFKDIFKDSLFAAIAAFNNLGVCGIAPFALMNAHAQFEPDIPFPPPRPFSSVLL